jgi:hypothetical protein
MPHDLKHLTSLNPSVLVDQIEMTPGMVVYTCIPEANLGFTARPCLKTKQQQKAPQVDMTCLPFWVQGRVKKTH